MKFMRRVLCVGLLFCLLMTNALAMPFSEQAMYFLDKAGKVRFAANLSVTDWMPYSDTLLNPLNVLLNEVYLLGSYQTQDGAELSTLSIQVEDTALFTLSEKNKEGQSELVSTLLPKRILQANDSVLATLFPTEDTTGNSFDPHVAFAELDASYQELTDAIIPYAEEKKANYNIKKIGRSNWSRIARLTPEQTNLLIPSLAKVLGAGMDEPFKQELMKMTTGNGFIIGLYQSEKEGEDMAVYIKGTIYFADETARSLSFQWAFHEDDTSHMRTDTYKFEMKKNRAPTDHRLIYATHERSTIENGLMEKGETEIILNQNNNVTKTVIDSDLKGMVVEGETTLLGSHTQQQTVTPYKKNATTTVHSYTPDITVANGWLKGNVGYSVKVGKAFPIAMEIAFVDAPPTPTKGAVPTMPRAKALEDSSLSQNWEEVLSVTNDPFVVSQPPLEMKTYPVPTESTVVVVNTTDIQEELKAEMAQRLASQMIGAIPSFSKEAQAFFSYSIDTEAFDTFFRSMDFSF